MSKRTPDRRPLTHNIHIKILSQQQRHHKTQQSAEADLLRQQGEGKQKKQATVQIIPTAQHILDNYDTLTIAEKNRLWKLVMPKATVYRSPDNELTVNIYPNLPK